MKELEEQKQRAKLTDEEIFELLPGYYDSQKFMWEANPEHKGDAAVSPAPDYIAIRDAQLRKAFNQPLYFKIEKPLPLPYECYTESYYMGWRGCIVAMLQREKESYIPTGETK